MPDLATDGAVQETALAGAVVATDDTHGEEVLEDGSKDSKTKAKTRVLGPDLLRGLLMMLQAIDHCAMSLGAWKHGVAQDSEGDGVPVSQWNTTVAYVARNLTHLCAPGFMFLLGVGIVFFGRSRRNLGWGPGRLAWHFAVRGFVLALLNQIFITLPGGRGKFWMMNAVLIALAANYVLAGLLWMALSALEDTLAAALGAFRSSEEEPEEGEERPLLETSLPKKQNASTSSSANIAWHVHNLILLLLTGWSAWWNIALSPHGGHCVTDTPSGPFQAIEVYGPAIDFWFYPVFSAHFMSGFPPLAWLSYALLGLLYGRIATARRWKPYVLNTGTAVAGQLFAIFFVATRLLHFGNLSEDCLHMPEHWAQPAGANQYLASVRSFLYIVKYPPDVAFFALTMSVNFLLLAFFGTWSARTAQRWIFRPLMVFGTSALFFYLLHMWVYMTLSIPAKWLFGHETGEKDPFSGSPQISTGSGAVTWITYLLGLAILYPICRWYGDFKSRKGPDSVWRFF